MALNQLHKFGTPVLVRDLNNNRSNDPDTTKYGLTTYMNLQNPAQHYIYFPQTKTTPVIREQILYLPKQHHKELSLLIFL